jgi:hypothetical protein
MCTFRIAGGSIVLGYDTKLPIAEASTAQLM